MPMFRHAEIYMRVRLDKEPLHRQPAKRLELELSAVLTNRGISAGEAARLAAECSRNPTELAERLHQIASEYLNTLALMARAFAPALPPAIVEAVAAIDGTSAPLYGGKLAENLVQSRAAAILPDPSKFAELFPGAQEYVERCQTVEGERQCIRAAAHPDGHLFCTGAPACDQFNDGKQCLRHAGHLESHVFTFPTLDPPAAP